jgi:hypothetical protein
LEWVERKELRCGHVRADGIDFYAFRWRIAAGEGAGGVVCWPMERVTLVATNNGTVNME